MKEEHKPEEWLGSVYEFLIRSSELVRKSGGTVVKRIGDEIMATFPDFHSSEQFITAVIQDQTLSSYKFKIAVDAGEAYHFRFIEDREDDPYGTVVDRCARIAKLGRSGFILCSGSYHALLSTESKAQYLHVGDFFLKGLSKSSVIYLRNIGGPDSKEYLQTLLLSANTSKFEFDGFKQTGRKLTVSQIRDSNSDKAKPFLARELLNLPRCPYSAVDFFAARKEFAQNVDKEFFDTRFLGYIVEWVLNFGSYSNSNGHILVFGQPTDKYSSNHVVLHLPIFSREIVQLFQEGQQFNVRGVLVSMQSQSAWLDYVDIEFLSSKVATKATPAETKLNSSKGFFRRH